MGFQKIIWLAYYYYYAIPKSLIDCHDCLKTLEAYKWALEITCLPWDVWYAYTICCEIKIPEIYHASPENILALKTKAHHSFTSLVKVCVVSSLDILASHNILNPWVKKKKAGLNHETNPVMLWQRFFSGQG